VYLGPIEKCPDVVHSDSVCVEKRRVNALAFAEGMKMGGKRTSSPRKALVERE